MFWGRSPTLSRNTATGAEQKPVGFGVKRHGSVGATRPISPNHDLAVRTRRREVKVAASRIPTSSRSYLFSAPWVSVDSYQEVAAQVPWSTRANGPSHRLPAEAACLVIPPRRSTRRTPLPVLRQPQGLSADLWIELLVPVFAIPDSEGSGINLGWFSSAYGKEATRWWLAPFESASGATTTCLNDRTHRATLNAADRCIREQTQAHR